MEITIGGMIDLKLKSKDQVDLEFLKEKIQKLEIKVEKEVEKNIQLEERLKNL